MVRTFMLFIAAMLFLFAAIFAKPPAQAAEQISMPRFPDNFVAGERKQTRAFDYATFIPEGSDPNLWDQRITIEVYQDMETMPLDAIHRRAVGDLAINCQQDAAGGPLQEGMVHGRRAVFWTQGCGKRLNIPGGLVRYVKAITGLDALYVIAWEWQTDAFEGDDAPINPKEQERAIAFLQSVAVCKPGERPACAAD